jgi:hypothetical protein
LLDKLNTDLDAAVERIDKILDEKIGAAQVAVQRATLSLQDVLLAALFYSVAIVSIAAVSFIVVSRIINDSYSGPFKSKPAFAAVDSAAAASVLVVLALYALKFPLTGQLFPTRSRSPIEYLEVISSRLAQ